MKAIYFGKWDLFWLWNMFICEPRWRLGSWIFLRICLGFQFLAPMSLEFFLSVILHYRWSHVATFGFTLVTKAVSYDQCAQALTDWSFTSCVVLINSTKPTFLEFIFLCNSFLIQIKLSLWFIIVLIFFSIFWILFFL